MPHASSTSHLRRHIQWKDLVVLRHHEVIKELLLPVPWLLAAYWLMSSKEIFWLGLAIVGLFMTSLRVAHNAFHFALGLPRSFYKWVIFLISIPLLGSSHAIQYTHLYHHRNCLKKDDVEGHLAHLPFAKALLFSATYPFRIHAVALKKAGLRIKLWIIAELASSFLVHIFLSQYFEPKVLLSYTLWMLLANCLAPMLGIWAVHQACEGSNHLARTARHTIFNYVTIGMFYHWEHHLFPAVPTCHISQLAKRLDEAVTDTPLLRKNLNPCTTKACILKNHSAPKMYFALPIRYK